MVAQEWYKLYINSILTLYIRYIFYFQHRLDIELI